MTPRGSERGAWGPVPGPADRVTFLEERRRHRRATWRLAALCGLAVVGLGIPLSLVLTPLLYALLLVAVHVAGLVLPLPPAVWAGFRVVGLLVVRTIERLLAGHAPPPLVLAAAAALLVPGALALGIVWLGLRALLLRAGTDGVLQHLGARPPREGDLEECQLVNVVAEMALAAGVPPLRVMLLDADAPNAAAIGASIDDGTLVVSRRLLDELDRDETQGLIGHLVGSVGNGDLRIALTVLSVFETYGALVTLLDAPFGSESRRVLGRLLTQAFGRRGDAPRDAEAVSALLARRLRLEGDDDLGRFLDAEARKPPSALRQLRDLPLIPLMWASLSVKLMASLSATIVLGPLIALTWRTRRYLADATAVQLTRNPDGLARALGRLAATDTAIPGGQRAGLLFVVWPDAPRERTFAGEHGVLAAFHPPLARRLARLRAVGARIASDAQPGTGRPRGWLPVAAGVLLLGPLLLLGAYLLLCIVAMLAAMSLLFTGLLLLALYSLFSLLH